MLLRSLLTAFTRLALLLGCALLLATPVAVYAAGIVVDTLADAVAVNAQCSLREAIDNANDNAATHADCVAGSGADTITFDASIGNGTIVLSATLPNITAAGGPLTFDGTGRNITISGNNANGVLVLDMGAGTDVQILGLTVANVRGGSGSTPMAAITTSGTLTVIDSAFTGTGGSPPSRAAALFNEGGTVIVSGSTFSGNRSIGEGGAIRNAGTLTITTSTFSNNLASDNGGAIAALTGVAIVTNSAFSNNRSINAVGGAISSTNGTTLTVINSTLTGNEALSGGALYIEGALTQGRLTNVTISGNTIDFADSGAGSGIVVGSGATVTLTNTLIAGNAEGDDCGQDGAPGTITGTNNLIGEAVCGGLTHGDAGNITGVAPAGPADLAAVGLGALADNGGPTQTMALLAGSPALDAGDAAACAAATTDDPAGAGGVDQRGIARPQGTACDIGAFEAATPTAFVVTSTNDTVDDVIGDGLCRTSVANGSVCTLRAAIQEANAIPGTQTITFDAAISGGTIVLSATLPEIIADGGPLTLDGTGRNITITPNNEPGRLVLFMGAGTEVQILGLTVANVRGISAGTPVGAIMTRGTLTVADSTFTGDSTLGSGSRAAALFNEGGTVIVSGSTFSGNLSIEDGGAIWNMGILTVTTSTFSNNRASRHGGAIMNESSGVVTVTNSVFSDNRSNGGGGAILSSNGSTLTVSNSTLTGNEARDGGGALYLNGAAGSLTNVTISGNTTDFAEGGVGSGIAVGDGATVTLTNTLIASNAGGDDCAQQVGPPSTITGTNNLIGEATCGGLTHGVAGNILGIAPAGPADLAAVGLGALADNGGPTQTMALLAGSPALDAGDAAACAAATTDVPAGAGGVDQRGIARPQGTACDIGAYEALLLSLVVNDIGDDGDASIGDGVCATSGAVCTLRAAIQEANASPGADTITFDAAIGGGTIVLSEMLPDITAAGGPLTLDGTGRNVTITPDNVQGRLVIFMDAGTDVQILGLTVADVRGGASPGPVGAITTSGTLTVVDSTFTGDGGGGTGSRASALFNDGGTLVVTGSTFSGNFSPNGGGAIMNYGTLTVTTSAFSNNVTHSNGGAIANFIGVATVTSSVFSNNRSSSAGGAIYSEDGPTLTVINSTFTGNEADGGGALFIHGALTQGSLTNVTITGNDADSAGGGGGIATSNAATVTLTNTLIAGNAEGDCVQFDLSSTITGTNNLIGAETCGGITDGVDGNITGVAPAGPDDLAAIGLGALADNGGPTQTMALLSGSPALGKGNAAACAAATTDDPAGADGLDQRGIARPQGTACDIGAYEALRLAIAGVTLAEGDAGGTTFNFPVTLSSALPAGFPDVTAQYATANGTALAPGDYTAVAAGTLTFTAGGAVTQNAAVTVAGDTAFEANETFLVALSAAVGAVIVDGPATGTISNDDTATESLVMNDTGDDGDASPGDGVCATAGGVCTLRAGIEEANALDGAQTLTLGAGTTTVLANLPPITQDLVIEGQGPGVTIIDLGTGADAVRGFVINGVTATIRDLTTTGGTVPSGSNAGIVIHADNNASVTIDNVAIEDFVHTQTGTHAISTINISSLFMSNSSVSGGEFDGAGVSAGTALYVGGGAAAEIRGSAFTDNSGSATLLLMSGSLLIEDTLIAANTTTNAPLQLSSGNPATTLTVRRSVLRDNSGNRADAMYVNSDGTATIEHSVLIANPLGANQEIFSDGPAVTATNNWWGSATGPVNADTESTTAPFLAALPVVAVDDTLTTGTAASLAATLQNSAASTVAGSGLGVRFTRTGANTGTADDLTQPWQHGYTGSNAGTDTVTAALLFGPFGLTDSQTFEAATLTGQATLTYAAPPAPPPPPPPPPSEEPEVPDEPALPQEPSVPVVNGVLTNADLVGPLEIQPGAVINGGRLRGRIINRGLITGNITLGPDTVIEGGIVSGNISGDPDSPALLLAADIPAGTRLENVVIGAGTVLDPDVVLGPNVIFDTNSLVPPGIDLTGALPVLRGDFHTAPDLGGDLVPGAGILADIGSLAEVAAFGISQLNSGELVIAGPGSRSVLLPLHVSQAAPDIAPGVYADASGKLVFITADRRQVTMVPVLADLPFFLGLLEFQGLTLVFDANDPALFRVFPAQGGFYYVGRAGTSVVPAFRSLQPSVHAFLLEKPADVIGFSVIFKDANGVLLEQDLVSMPTDWDALQQRLAAVPGISDIRLDEEGVISVVLDGVSIEGRVGYVVTLGEPGGSNTVLLEPAGDLNADGTEDYHLRYPNGDVQELYVYP